MSVHSGGARKRRLRPSVLHAISSGDTCSTLARLDYSNFRRFDPMDLQLTLASALDSLLAARHNLATGHL